MERRFGNAALVVQKGKKLFTRTRRRPSAGSNSSKKPNNSPDKQGSNGHNEHEDSQAEKKVSFIWLDRQCLGNEMHKAVADNDFIQVSKLCKTQEDVLEPFTYSTDWRNIDGVVRKQHYQGQAIHVAASRGEKDMVALLFAKQANIHARVIRDGAAHYGVIHAAVYAEGKRKANPEVVRFLMDCKAAPFSTNLEGENPLHLAYKTGCKEIIALIQSRACDDDSPDGRTTFNAMESIDKTDNNGRTPLVAGFQGGNLSHFELADLAPLTGKSMRLLLDYERSRHAAAIVRFVDRCVQDVQNKVPQKGEGTTAGQALVQKLDIDIVLIEHLLEKSPKSATKLLEAVTCKPEVENCASHALPRRACVEGYLKGCDGGWLRKYLNPDPDTFSFYVADNRWTYDPIGHTGQPWHSRLEPSSSTDGRADDLDITVNVCFVPSLMRLQIIAAILGANDIELFQSHVIRALIDQSWWLAAWRYDALQVLLNVWSLLLVTLHIMGFEVEFFVDFVSARGVADLIFELIEFLGFCKAGQWTGYLTISNLIEIVMTILNIFTLIQPDSKELLSIVVITLWCRLLGVFRCAEKIAVVLMPIQRSAYSVTPAICVTLVCFFALLEATIIFANKDDYEMARYAQFALLFLGEVPDDPPDGILMSCLVYFGVMIFTIFLLNIFIGIISEAYKTETDKVRLHFYNERAEGVRTFFLRARFLPSKMFTLRTAKIIVIAALCAAVYVQVLFWQAKKDRWLGVLVFLFVILLLNVAVFQTENAPWQTLETCVDDYYLWLAIPVAPEHKSDVSYLQDQVAEIAEDLRSLRQEVRSIRDADAIVQELTAIRHELRDRDEVKRELAALRKEVHARSAPPTLCLPGPPVSPHSSNRSAVEVE